MNVEKDEMAGKIPPEIATISMETTISTENAGEIKKSADDKETVPVAAVDTAGSVMQNETDTASNAVSSNPASNGSSGISMTKAASMDAGSTETISADADSKEAVSADADSATTASTDADSTATSLTAVESTTTDATAVSEEPTHPEESAVKKKINKKRLLWGILELTIAALILIFSAYLFYNTRGTRLLFINVTFGRICRYYWIGMLTAVILGLAGWLTLKWQPKTVAKTDNKEAI